MRDCEYCRIIVLKEHIRHRKSISEFFMKKWDEPAHHELMIALQLWVAKVFLN